MSREIALKLKRYEKRLSNRNYKEFDKCFELFYNKIQADNSNFASFSNIKIDYEEFARLIKEYLIKVFTYNVNSVISTYTKLFKWTLSKSKVAGIKDRMLNEYNKKYAASKVTQMTETTRKVLNGVLVDSQAKGLGIKDTLKNILGKVEDMRLSRAKTIARTETSSAINNTSLRTAKEAKMRKKTWIWIGGRYTFRENHRRLNGLTIGIDEYFDLGKGIKTLSPHHPSLPASEVCNCSCLITFK